MELKIKIGIIAIGVVLGYSTFAQDFSAAAAEPISDGKESVAVDDGVARSVHDIESRFVEQQNLLLPISPPSEKVYIDTFKVPVAIDFKKFPKEFTSQLHAEMQTVDGSLFPVYEIFVYEDASVWPREVVFENSGAEIYRMEIDALGYDPYEWQTLRFGEVLDDPAMRWVFDPAHIAVRFVALVPEIFHTDYLLAQGLDVPETMEMATLSIPAPPENTNTTSGGGSTSNMIATLKFSVPSGFGASFAEIFQKTNLVAGAGNWSVLAENVAVTAGTQRVWTDMASSNVLSRFYILNDPSKDFDGDFLNDGMEQYVTRSLTNNADSDGGTVPDGYEAARGMDPNDSADDAAALAAYLAVAGDSDGDLSPNWVESRDGTNPHDRFD